MPKVVLEVEVKKTGDAVIRQVEAEVEGLTKKVDAAAGKHRDLGKAADGATLSTRDMRQAIGALSTAFGNVNPQITTGALGVTQFVSQLQGASASAKLTSLAVVGLGAGVAALVAQFLETEKIAARMAGIDRAVRALDLGELQSGLSKTSLELETLDRQTQSWTGTFILGLRNIVSLLPGVPNEIEAAATAMERLRSGMAAVLPHYMGQATAKHAGELAGIRLAGNQAYFAEMLAKGQLAPGQEAIFADAARTEILAGAAAARSVAFSTRQREFLEAGERGTLDIESPAIVARYEQTLAQIQAKTGVHLQALNLQVLQLGEQISKRQTEIIDNNDKGLIVAAEEELALSEKVQLRKNELLAESVKGREQALANFNQAWVALIDLEKEAEYQAAHAAVRNYETALEREQRLLRERLKIADDYTGKTRAALQLQLRDWRTTDEQILDVTRAMGKEATRTLDDVFFSVVKGRFEDLDDVVSAFGDALLRLGTNEAAKATLSLLGGGGGGSGLGSWLGGAGDLLGSFGSNLWGGITQGMSWLGGMIGFQTGLWNVPDMPGREAAFIHPGEMILPPHIAERVRANGGLFGWGPGLPGFEVPYASGDHTGGVGLAGMTGTSAMPSAVADVIGSILGPAAQLSFSASVALHSMKAGVGILGAMANPTPFGMLAAFGTLSKAGDAISAAMTDGLAEAYGISRTAAQSVVEATRAAIEAGIVDTTNLAGLSWGIARDAEEAASAELGNYGKSYGSWGEPGAYGGWAGGGFTGYGRGSIGSWGGWGTGFGGWGGFGGYAGAAGYDTRGQSEGAAGQPGSETGAGASIGSDTSQGNDVRLLGGPVAAGRAYQVHPPELFVPSQPGRIVSRQETAALLEGGAATIVVHQTFDLRGCVVPERIPRESARAIYDALEIIRRERRSR
jgi:hypothetical protein